MQRPLPRLTILAGLAVVVACSKPVLLGQKPN